MINKLTQYIRISCLVKPKEMLKNILPFVVLLWSTQVVAQFRFIENKNQWDAQAKFRAELPGGYLFLEDEALTYLFYDPSSFPQHHGSEAHHGNEKSHQHQTESDGVRGHVVKVKFLGANQQPRYATAKQRPEYYNFLRGKNPAKWGHHANAYEEVSYQDLYPNVDLKFYTTENDLKYEFIVKPNGNPTQIQLEYQGQDDVYLEDGNLYIKTSVNAFREAKPYCYQLIDGLELEVESKFELNGDVLSYHFPSGYDKNYPLIIDPTLVFSTFSGSFQDNWGFTATPDDDGHLYAGGMAFRTGEFPTTIGAFQENAPSGGSEDTDIAIIKYTPDGTGIVYATYLGGTLTDLPHSLIVNSQNQLIVMGSTSSDDFPMTSSAFDDSFNGGTIRSTLGLTFLDGSDMFLAVLSEDGSDLVGATYFGGSENDGLNPDNNGGSDLTFNYGDEFRGDMIIDDVDNIYICSVTQSSDFPTTSNAFQSGLSGDLDAIIAKFSPTTANLEWSTYLGGAELESAYGIKLNELNEVIVAGGTSSTNFPTTSGVINENYQGGSTDGFITIMNASGSGIVASTFLGTDRYDQAYLLDTDEFGNIGVFGQTTGLYEVSADSLYQNPRSGQFIHKMSSDLQSTIFSTVVGGGSAFTSIAEINIRPTAFLINSCSHIYLAGWGGEINFGYGGGDTNGMPVTSDAFQSVTDGDDFYLMILNANATSLLYGTYFGALNARGDHVDGGTSRFDKNGTVYQAVCACGSSAFPTTPGVVSELNNSSNCNNAAFKFDFQGINAEVNPTVPDDNTGVFVPGDEGCAPLEVVFTDEDLIGNEFLWNFGDGNTIIAGAVDVPHTYTTPGTYIVTIRVEDSATCQIEDQAVDTITVFPSDFTIAGDADICQGESTPLTATGGETYTWTPTTGLDDANSATPIATPMITTTYTLLAVNEFGCEFTDEVTVNIAELNSAFDTTWLNVCDTVSSLQIITESNSTAQSYLWTLDGTQINPSNPNNFILEFDDLKDYELVLFTKNGDCESADTVNFTIEFNNNAITLVNLTLSDEATICEGDTIPLMINGATSYLWSPAASLNDDTSDNPLASPTVTTDYQIRAFTPQGGCFQDTSLLITVIPKVTLDFGYVWSSAECGEFPVVSFLNNSTGTEDYTWSFDGSPFIGRTPPAIEPDEDQLLKVILTGGDPLCAQTDSIEVPINRFGVPPNAFSPNGDGMNDTFVIEGLGDDWKLAIYNRWGKLVYESANYQSDWDGGDNGGETFFYILTSPAGNTCRGYIHVLKGSE